MSTREQMTKVWAQAAHELGFQFLPDFTLTSGGAEFKYFGLLPEFGSSRGMLLITGKDYEDHVRAAEQQGFGYSCMSESEEPYDRESFIDVLNDWGWTGPSDRRPQWYTGEPWTA